MSVVIPIFRMFDYKKTVEFYVDWLGFKIDWQHTFEENAPIYMQLSFRNIVLHLSEHHGDGSPGAKVLVEDFENLKAYHKQLIDKKYKYNRPGIGAPYWNPEITAMEVNDPFHNVITFTENKPFQEE